MALCGVLCVVLILVLVLRCSSFCRFQFGNDPMRKSEQVALLLLHDVTSHFAEKAENSERLCSYACLKIFLFYGVAFGLSGSDITPCNNIDKPPVVYRLLA